jgi:predicted nuclease with TOPRIM domain
MNAVLRECEQAEGAHMPGNERDDQAVQIAELRADVRHIQSDTTDIKAELRATNQRIDSLRQGTDERFEKLNQRIDGRFEKVDDRFGKLEQKFDELKDSLASAKVWALGLYIALSGSLLYVLARGFKWL